MKKTLSSLIAFVMFAAAAYTPVMPAKPAHAAPQQANAWKDQIIMTIEPAKFASGDGGINGVNANPSNDITRFQFNLDDPSTPYNGAGFFGGDLAGLANNVEHIKKTGITTALIYPIMMSDKNDFFYNLSTGYNVVDWTKIDPNFNVPGADPSDDTIYREVVNRMHDPNIGGYRVNVIQDLAFSIAGFENPKFTPAASADNVDFFRRWDPDTPSNNVNRGTEYQVFGHSERFDLSPYFNEDVFSYHTDMSDGTVTGTVYSLPAELVANSAYAFVGNDGIGFDFGLKLNGYNNAIVGSATADTAIGIPEAKYAVVALLAGAANGNQNVTVQVEYTDGTWTDTAISATDWGTGFFQTVTFGHRHSPSGEVATPAYLYTYMLQVDPTKTAKRIVVKAGAGAENFHIFAASGMRITPSIKVDLTDYYNEDGFSLPSDPGDSSGPIRATGNVFPSLPYYYGNQIAQYFKDPAVPAYDGAGHEPVPTSFAVGPLLPGRNNMVYADGQTIDVMNTRYHEFRIAAFGSWNADGSGQVFKVNYTDGTSTETVLDIKPMNGSVTAGDTVVYESGTSVASFDLTNWFEAPNTVRIWGYKLNVDWTKTVESITLPVNSNVHIVGISPIIKLDSNWGAPVVEATAGMEDESGAFAYTWNNIVKFWMDKGIDGVRIDSVQNYRPSYWQKVMNAPGYFRDTYPNAFVLGEAAVTPSLYPWHLQWEQYTNQDGGVGFNGIYDWSTSEALRRTFAKDEPATGSATSLIEESIQWDAKYDEPWNQVAFFNVYENFPFLHEIDDTLYPTYEDKLPKLKLAAAYLFAINRVPMLFSGNEYLLEYGETAPKGSNARKPGYLFTDEVQDNPVYQDNFAYMQALIAMRKNNPALRSAERMTEEKWIRQDEKLFGFIRQEAGSPSIVAMFNNSPDPVGPFDTALPAGVTGQTNYNFIKKDENGNYGAPDETVSWPNPGTLRISSMEPWEVKIIKINPEPAPSPGPVVVPNQPEPADIVTEEDEESVTISVKVNAAEDSDAGTATAKIESKDVKALLDKAAEAASTGKKKVFAFRIESGAKSVSVSLEKEDFRLLADSEADIQLDAGFGTIVFDAEAVAAIHAAAGQGEVRFEIRESDPAGLTPEMAEKVADRPLYEFKVTAGDAAVTQFDGGFAQIGIPYVPKPDEKTNAIVVYFIGGDGKAEAVRSRYDAASGTVIFKTPHFSKFAVAYNDVRFHDVADDAWYSDAVGFLAARDIVKGMPNGTFAPNHFVKRADFLIMAMNAFGIAPDDNATDHFSDTGNSYYTAYVATAKRLGIVNGTGDNQFMPDKPISRQDMLVILHRLLEYAGELPETATGASLAQFEDVGDIAGYAREAVKRFVETGTVRGNGKALMPGSPTTRAQAAQVLYNLLDR